MKSSRFYQTFIESRDNDPNIQNQTVVLNWLLVGSLGLTFVALVNTLISFIVLHDAYLLLRLPVIIGFLSLFGILLGLSRIKHRQRLPAAVLVAMFFGAAVSVVYLWSIINPVGILLFSLSIVMAGILLGARYSLYAALLTSLTLSLLEYSKAHHHLLPNIAWERRPSSFTDVVSFTAIFSVLALVSWLFNRRMEMALKRAKSSERALKRQRDLLEVKVEQRTRQLQAAQMEQIQEVYRFAELGHLSMALFHDMANHLASVRIDIKGLNSDPHSAISDRIQNNITHIDEVVRRVRRQIQGQSEIERFDVTQEISEVINILAYHSQQAKVTIKLEMPPTRQPIMYRGDLTRFRQIIINLLSNSIEAYNGVKRSDVEQVVTISIKKQDGNLMIGVTDDGKGIRTADQTRIFEPFYSTKEKGMGIGLFIVRQVTEKDFGGQITLTSNEIGTTFVVSLPLRRNGK